MRVEIKTIDPALIRYPTAGDWQWLADGALQVTMPDYGGQDQSALLVALHELVEAWLCKRDGVTDQEVTKWDTDNPALEEPGDDPRAPYHIQHQAAMLTEKTVAMAFGADWDAHNQWVINAGNEVERIFNRGDTRVSRIMVDGPRYWAELHMYALRHEGKLRALHVWFLDWMADLPFDGCPCKEHLDAFLAASPPDYTRFFDWTIKLHNAVNERLGKPIIDPIGARQLWINRLY